MRAPAFMLITLLISVLAAPVLAQKEPPDLRYQWTDPKTGQVIIKDYPPANLIVREVERRPDGLVILEVLPNDAPSRYGAGEVQGTLPYQSKKSNLPSDEELGQRCLEAARHSLAYFDPQSIRMEGTPQMRWAAIPGIGARQQIVIMVNAKNRYGGYVGAKPVVCTLRGDSQTIQEVSQ